MLKRVTLSTSGYKLSEDRQRIQASHLKIKLIDDLTGALARRVKSINLANNHLTKVDNIRQFISLQELDLRNNAIKNGRELLTVCQLPKLVRLYVQGNPFLLDPLDQSVLQLLIEKETDIEILSGQEVNRIKELQQGELKVVFLENYLKKINCHDEIMTKHFNKPERDRRSLLSQSSMNRHIISKIMPQFYTIIDDPRLNLKTRIKKQTISIKKERQVTFEDAIYTRKEKQQTQVNNLIKDILLLVEEKQQENYHSSSEIAESRARILEAINYREQSKGNSPSKNQATQTERQKLEADQNEFQQVNAEQYRYSINSFRKKLNRVKNDMANNKVGQQSKAKVKQVSTISIPASIVPPRSPSVKPKIETQKSQPIIEIPHVKGTLTPKSKSNKIQQKFIQTQVGMNKSKESSNFYSFNQTAPMPFNRSDFNIEASPQVKSPKQFSGKSKYEKLDNFRNSPKSSDFFDNYAFESIKRNQSELNPNIHHLSVPNNDSFSAFGSKPPSQIYDQYYAHLTKYNPTFALLYSEVSSLSGQQKQVLIEALAKDHKAKTIQLFMCQQKLKSLKYTSMQTNQAHQKQIQELITQINESKEHYHLSKRYSQQLQRQNARLNELIKVLTTDISDLKLEVVKQKKINQQKQDQIQYMQLDLKDKHDELKNIEQAEDKYEQVQNISKKRIKKSYYQIISKRALQNYKVQAWKQKRKQNEKARLIALSWSLMKKQLLIGVLVKMKQSQRNSNELKKVFNAWKIDTVEERQISKKQSKLKKLIVVKNYKILQTILQNKIKNKKQFKHHCFWANHHYLKNKFFKLVRKTRASKSKQENNMQISAEHKLKSILSLYFNKLNQATTISRQQFANHQTQLKNFKKRIFYDRIKKLYAGNMLNRTRKDNIKSLTRIVRFQLQDKKKRNLLELMREQNEANKQKLSRLLKLTKQKYLNRLFNNTYFNTKKKQLQNKSKDLSLKIYSGRFYNKMKLYMKFVKKVRKFYASITSKLFKRDALNEQKSNTLQRSIQTSKMKRVLNLLLRNKYQSKLFGLQVQQRMQHEQTSQLIQKMKALQSMQLQAIRIQHNKQLSQLEQQDIRKQVEHRNTVLDMETQKNQLQDQMRKMRKQIDQFRKRENVFFREKQLIQQQIKIAYSGKSQFGILNQNLRNQLDTINAKYQRMLDLYTQAMIQLEKRDSMHIAQKNKQRDKTIEKDKRQTGLAKNTGEFISLRQRVA